MMPRKRKEPTPQERENPTLASFQVNAGQWYDFGSLCEAAGISASQGLADYINACLASKQLIIESAEKLNIETSVPVIESNRTLIIESELARLRGEVERLGKLAAKHGSKIKLLEEAQQPKKNQTARPPKQHDLSRAKVG